MSRTSEVADLCMGWFWTPDYYFSNLDGVEEVITGYTGGRQPSPTFSNKMDHQEAVRIVFDPAAISYDEILEHFLEQGGLPTDGHCSEVFRPVIYTHNAQQTAKAEGLLQVLRRSKVSAHLPEVLPATDFYRAEDNHQQYMLKQRYSTDSDCSDCSR